jgi:formate hydrogenlyase subunit 3/multisubunit Na+/H+ antiporter MnhD subunit
LVSPALVLLATAAILEGYSLLNVIPTGEWRWSAIALVVLTVPLALALTRPRQGRRRTATQKLLAVSSTLLVALTVLTLLVDRSGVANLLAAYDLVFAAAALGSVLVVERSTHRG